MKLLLLYGILLLASCHKTISADAAQPASNVKDETGKKNPTGDAAEQTTATQTDSKEDTEVCIDDEVTFKDICNRCVCKAGKRVCATMCPPISIPSCSTGKVLADDIIIPKGNPGCGCRAKKCVDKPELTADTVPDDFKGCKIGDKAYEVGTNFNEDECTLCTCLGGKKKKCKKYCTDDEKPTCKDGQELVETEYTVMDTKCKCKKRTCKNEGCLFNGVTHKKGTKFEINSCTTCECKGADLLQCTPLCSASAKECNADSQIKITSTKFVQGTKCMCTTHRCQDIVCPIGVRRTIKKGESFARTPCLRCTCGGNGILSCKNLCPTGFLNNVLCAANQNTALTPYTIQDTTCSCPIRRCIPKAVPIGNAGCACTPIVCVWPLQRRTGSFFTDARGCTCPLQWCGSGVAYKMKN